jgi:hypothetical protein
MHEHHLPLDYILGTDPARYLSVPAGLALLEARRERLHPGSTPSHAACEIATARAAVRARMTGGTRA